MRRTTRSPAPTSSNAKACEAFGSLSGAKCRDRLRSGRLQRVGHSAAPHAAAQRRVWELFVGTDRRSAHKYYVRSHLRGYQQMKADPMRLPELPLRSRLRS
jgi:hypothetical protein